MRPGDVILASPRTRRLSLVALLYRLLLRSRYVHAMLYVGGGRLIHTTWRHGVVEGPLPRSVFRAERYRVYRAPGLDAAERRAVVARARERLGTPLDRRGLITNVPSRLLGLRHPLAGVERSRLWCSKLIAEAYAEQGVELVSPERAENITSEDLSRSPALERI